MVSERDRDAEMVSQRQEEIEDTRDSDRETAQETVREQREAEMGEAKMVREAETERQW